MVNIDEQVFNLILEEIGVGGHKENCCPYIQDNHIGNYGEYFDQVVTYYPIDYDFKVKEESEYEYDIDNDFERSYLGVPDFITIIKTSILRKNHNISLDIETQPNGYEYTYTVETITRKGSRLKTYGSSEVEAYYILIEALYFIEGKLSLDTEVYPFDILYPHYDKWYRYEDGEYMEIENGSN